MLRRWAIAGLLAIVAFAISFAVTGSSGSEEPSRPAAEPFQTRTFPPPTTHNLERVDGIRPLREAP